MTAESARPGAERLRQRDEIRHHAVVLAIEHAARAAEPGLRLVDDHQHAALARPLGRRLQIALGRHDDAAARQDRFEDQRGGAAGRLAVEQFEAVVEFRFPVVGVAIHELRAIRRRRRQRERSRQRRAVSLPAAREGRRRGATRDAVPRARQRQHLVAARRRLGHAQRGFVRFAARRQQQHAAELARRQLGQLLREVDHRPRQELAVEMHEFAGLLADHRGDLGMAVAEDRAHLPRREIEDAAAVGGGHEGALRLVDDHRLEVVAVAHEMAIGARPQCVFISACRSRHSQRLHRHRIWLRNARVRGSLALAKKVAGGPCSTITPRSVK